MLWRSKAGSGSRRVMFTFGLLESGLFQGDSGAVLLLLDRREDPATPLL